MTANAVLPDEVSRDHKALAAYVFLQLTGSGDVATRVATARALSATIATFRACEGTTACVGFGTGWFAPLPQRPVELAAPPVIPQGTTRVGDVVVYALSLTEETLGELLINLAAVPGVVVVGVERGFQRASGRELSGFKDGLRNAQTRRSEVVFVDRDRQPEDAPATEGGTYMAFLKIRQNLAAWSPLGTAQQEQVIGRRLADGSRNDLPEGTPIVDEPSPHGLAPASHVAKTGPRGVHDRIEMFRRGVPYVTFGATGVELGLLFTSFQASLSQFDVIVNHWMFNPNFPTPGTGNDQLFAGGHATIVDGGFYFVADETGEFLTSEFFRVDSNSDHCYGRVVVRKHVVDTVQSGALHERGGFVFQLFTPDASSPVGAVFETDSTGRGVSEPVPFGTYILRELIVPPTMQPPADTTVVVDRRRIAPVEITNITLPGSPYGR